MQRPQNQDEKLQQLLQEWQTNEPLPPQFQEHVWRRIDQAQTPSRAPLPWFVALFLRPAFATVAATLLLLGGLAVGYLQADRVSAQWKDQLAHRYVTLMNPYASPHQ